MTAVADVIDALATLLPAETVDGYANERLANFFLWLHNDRPWREKEVALFKAQPEDAYRSSWGPKAWEKLWSFYMDGERVHRHRYEGEKLTAQDWALVRQESILRYQDWLAEVLRARKVVADQEWAQRQQEKAQEAARRKALEPITTPERPFLHRPWEGGNSPELLELERQLAMNPHNAQARSELIREAQAAGHIPGPSPRLSFPSLALLKGEAMLIRLRADFFSGAVPEVVEVKPGDYIRIHGNSKYGKVLSIYPNESDGGRWKSITYEVTQPGRRKQDSVYESTTFGFTGDFTSYNVVEVVHELPHWATTY